MKGFVQSTALLIVCSTLLLAFSSSVYFSAAQIGSIIYDPISNTINVSDYPAVYPCSFTALWAADKSGTLTLASRNGITARDANPVSLDTNLRPADYGVLGGAKRNLYVTVTGFSGLASAQVRIIGADSSGNSQSETFTVTGNGDYYATYSFAALTSSQVVAVTGNGSFDYLIVQKQWGVVWRQGTTQFAFGTHINIASGSYLNDTDKQITLNAGVIRSNADTFIGGDGYFTSGKVLNGDKKTSSNGCSFYTHNQGYWFYWVYLPAGGSYIYSSLFDAGDNNAAIVYATTLWSSIGTGKGFNGFHTGASQHTDFFNVICLNTRYGVYYDDSTGSAEFNRITLMGVTYGIRNWANANGATVSNVYARNCTYLFSTEDVTRPISQYLVNLDTDAWTFNWVGEDPVYPNTDVLTVHRQYTIDLVVANSSGTVLENANVTIFDKNGRVFSDLTNSSGKIPTERVSRGFYNYTGGNAMYDFAPFRMTITAPDYVTYSVPVMLEQRIDWQVTLQAVSEGGTQMPYTFSRFTFAPSNPNENATVTFNAALSESSAPIESQNWDFGDGTTVSDLVVVTHAYSAKGNYTVTLTVSSADGTDTFSQTINVGETSIISNIIDFQWLWWVLLAVLLILLLLLLLLLLLRRRDVIIVQVRGGDDPKCLGNADCDACKLTPC